MYREYRILVNTLEHDGIVKLFSMIVSNHSIYLIMEHAGKASLFDFLLAQQSKRGRPLPPEFGQKMFRQSVCAMVHCHTKMVDTADLFFV